MLLAIAGIFFALFFWETSLTYDSAPPQPDRFAGADGATLMTVTDIASGKGGFQKAALMDYGSLYGMGSYFGEDYTPSALRQQPTLTKGNLAQARFGKAFDALAPEQQSTIVTAMQR
jgi:nitric oxide reductase subunit B